MADPQGLAIFPGIQQIESAEYTLSHGITPGVCTIQMAPQPGFPAEGGTLVFTYSGASVIEFPDCKIDLYSFRAGDDGQMWTISILDRRWKWRFGTISGAYNVKDGDGKPDKEREQTPQQLAALCLLAMGESRFDISQLPNIQRPTVDWDHDNPAQCLDELANQLGCRVVLQLNNTVLIARAGTGAELPNNEGTESVGDGLNPPERPLHLLLVGGKKRFQADFLLRAVGKDTDGTIKAIDDLSYAPAAGWGNMDVPYFEEIEEGEKRELAKATVFRWYRIFRNRDNTEPLDVPGYGKLRNGFQIVPIESVQVETYEDNGAQPPNGVTSPQAPLPAAVFGIYVEDSLGYDNSDPDTPFRQDGFNLLGDEAIVEFSDYVYQYDDGAYAEATLYLRVAFSIRNEKTWAWERYERARQIGSPAVATPPRVVKRDEIVHTTYPVYDDETNRLVLINVNTSKVEKEADYYLDAAQAEYQIGAPSERTYIGILPISPDGAIQQVGWSVGDGGASTRASRNNEYSLVVPSYAERRRFEQLRLDAIRQMTEAVRKQRGRKDGR